MLRRFLVPAGFSTPFSPTQISGLKGWWKAGTGLFQNSNGTTAVTADGDPVGYWADQSGNSNHGTQATAGSRPTYKAAQQNGYGGILGDGVDDFLVTPINAAGPYNIFTVIKSALSLFNSYYGVLDASTNDNLHEWATFRPGNTNFWHPPAAVRKNAVDIPSQDLAPISSAFFLLNIQTGTKSADIRNILKMGAFRGNATIVEQCAYDNILSGANTTLVENYFNSKFAIY